MNDFEKLIFATVMVFVCSGVFITVLYYLPADNDYNEHYFEDCDTPGYICKDTVQPTPFDTLILEEGHIDDNE